MQKQISSKMASNSNHRLIEERTNKINFLRFIDMVSLAYPQFFCCKSHKVMSIGNAGAVVDPTYMMKVSSNEVTTLKNKASIALHVIQRTYHRRHHHHSTTAPITNSNCHHTKKERIS